MAQNGDLTPIVRTLNEKIKKFLAKLLFLTNNILCKNSFQVKKWTLKAVLCYNTSMNINGIMKREIKTNLA